MTRRTKIVVTIGPASGEPAVLKRLLSLGADIFRLNLAHGTYQERRREIRHIRRLAKSAGKTVAILADLGGAKVRLRNIPPGTHLVEGEVISITSHAVPPRDSNAFTLSHPRALREMRRGMELLVDDGERRLVITKTSRTQVRARVTVGGPLREGVGCMVRGVTFSIPSLSAKDRKDLQFALREGVDAIAVSFVKSAQDIRVVRRLLPRHTAPLLMAKIETPAAVRDIDAIIAESDGIMIARGDLGLALPPEEVPHVQKTTIEKALRASKPVITATQMLESMTVHPMPTRAEVSDVTNAILDGTDATMLSGETARGNYPIQATAVMVAIAERADTVVRVRHFAHQPLDPEGLAATISAAVIEAAENLNATAIVVFTESGATARRIARHRPQQPILAFSPHEYLLAQLMFSRGVLPFRIKPLRNIEDMLAIATRTIRARRLGRRGDRFVVSAGIPFRRAGTTNLLYVGTI